MLCKGRYCREKRALPFPLKSGYFTEVRCQELACESGSDPELCETCQEKAKKPPHPKYQESQFQGKIDEPYYPCSWLFGSDRFLKYHTMPGNALPADEYARAEAAQKIAQEGTSMGRKSGSSVQKSTATTQIPTPKPIKATLPKPTIPVAIECLEQPLEALDIRYVSLKKQTTSKKPVWIGEEFIFECLQNNRIGKTLQDFPQDSSEND